MLIAILLLGGIGMAWTLVAISQSLLVSRKVSISAFYALASLLAVPAAWLLCFRSEGREATAPRLGDLMCVLLGACLFNCAGQACLLEGMKRGHRAATLSIAQSAMVIPFCSAIFIWNEHLGALGIGGLLVVIFGIVLLSVARHDPAAPFNRRWFLFAAGSFLLIGAGQLLMIWPSHWSDWRDTARLRTPLTLSISCVIYLITMLALRERPVRAHLLPAGLWALGAVSAFLMLFLALDKLAAMGCAGCAFPIGIGLSLLGFALYSRFRLREPFSRPTLSGLYCVLAGIAAIVLQIAFNTYKETITCAQ